MNYEDRVTKEYVEGLLAGCGNCKIFAGSYVGTGTYGESNPTSLTFPFTPKLIAVSAGSYLMIVVHDCDYAEFSTDYKAYVFVSWSGNTVSWVNKTYGAEYQLNEQGTTYQYIGIG